MYRAQLGDIVRFRPASELRAHRYTNGSSGDECRIDADFIDTIEADYADCIYRVTRVDEIAGTSYSFVALLDITDTSAIIGERRSINGTALCDDMIELATTKYPSNRRRYAQKR